MATIHKLTKDGSTIFPATITDAIVHPNTGKTLTSMIKDYNVSELFPSEGLDGGNKYNLALAIQVLGSHLTAAEKTGGIKITFISSVSPYPEEEYYLNKNTWSTTLSDWGQRFEVGDVIANPSGSWEQGTAEEYIDQQTAILTTNLASETVARQTVDSNLQTQINTEVSTRTASDNTQNGRIGVLEKAYRNLTESDVIVGLRPSTGQQANVIYREPDQGHTPPQFYCDYMWYDNAWVLMAQYDNSIDNNPLPNSNNLVKSSGVFNSMGAFDISAYNSNHIYQNLTKALNAVPNAMRAGGMSVKFIQEITPAKYSLVKTEGLTTEPTGTELSSDPNLVSGTYTAAQLNNLSTVSALPTTLNSSKTYYLEVSGDSTTYTTWVVTYVSTSDNKYIQFRCKTQSFSANSEDWYFEGDDTLVDNPEYIRVVCDAEGRLLCWINVDGSIDWNIGVPSPIKNYIENQLTNGLSTKVDKEIGKSLISVDIVENIKFTDNPDWNDVKLDKNGRIIEGITSDFIKVINIPIDGINFTQNGIEKLKQDLINAGFEPGDIPTKTSQLTNDSGFITAAQIPSVSSSVNQGDTHAVSGNAVHNAIEQAQVEAAQVTIIPGQSIVTVASSDAPVSIKSACAYVCDGVNDEVEIQAALDSLTNGGLLHLTAGRFFISDTITLSQTVIVEGEGAWLDLSWDTRNSIGGIHGTIVKAVANVDIFEVGALKGVIIRDMNICGCGKLNEQNTSYGIHITGWLDISRFYNLNIQDCYIGIGADVEIDTCYIYNNSIQRNWLGMFFLTPFGDIHDNILCENRGLETLVINDTTYDIMCADLYTHNSGFLRLYNNTFIRSGTIIEKTGANRDVTWFKPMSSIVSRGCINEIYNNKFWQYIQGNCIAYLQSTFCSTWKIENNTFWSWGSDEAYENGYTDERYRACIYIEYSAVKGIIQNNYFLGDDPVNSVPERYYRTYAVYMKNMGAGEYDYGYSVLVFKNLFLNIHSDSATCCKMVGTNSVAQNNDIYNLI